MAARRRVRWSPEAEQDLIETWGYVADTAGQSVADAQLRRIDAVVAKLAEWPRSGLARDELLPGLRSSVVTPYLVFYRIAQDGIEIVRVLHGARDVAAIFTKPAP